MPRKPKHLQKTKEQVTAENYFPVDESNLKRTIEKKVEHIDLDSLQKIEVPGKKLNVPKKRTKGTKKFSPRKRAFEKIEFSPDEIFLKKNGYELIITEKPQAALKIASALGKSAKRDFQGIPYYEVDRKGKKIVVACAVGHLFTLKQESPGSGFPVFDIKWVPNFMARKKDFTKRYYDAISRLAKQAGEITIATDYDVEGEVIGFNVMRFLCGQKDANRMKFSTLTDKELNQSYESKSPSINWGQAIAGETRHYLDWYYGINLSRALMNAIKSIGGFKIMSIGRVQGPTLNLIAKKEKQIQDFKPKPYWEIYITVKNSHQLELKHVKEIFNKKELEKFGGLVGKKAEASTEKKEQVLQPNPPFSLTELQTESYRVYGITPARTLQIAQSLYLGGLISYPRTSSQKLPDSINYKEILEKLSEEYNVRKLIKRQKPVEGSKTDPAHPSIYPTGNRQILAGEDEKIYELIARRFLSLFCEDAIIDRKTIKVEINNMKFSTSGSAVRKKAWLEIYPIKMAEKEAPDLDGEVKIIDLRKEQKETLPPKRYTEASIVSELEKRNLGTKATRASIIETLYGRNYIREKSIEATPLGMSIIETLEKYSPVIIDEKLTREFENEMDGISKSKNGFEKKENQKFSGFLQELQEKEKKVVEKAKDSIKKISIEFKSKEKEIGKELIGASAKLNEELKRENTLNVCPLCKKGNLAITFSKKNRRYFVACDKYPDCKNTYSLPPNGLPKKANKICDECGFQMVMLLKRGRRPWIFCFNRECPTNRERMEKYRKKMENENAQEKAEKINETKE